METAANGMAEGSREQALAALWFDWDEAYQIEHAGDEWRAKRLDNLGGWIIADSPGELRQEIREDYALKPVERCPREPDDEAAVPGADPGALLAGG